MLTDVAGHEGVGKVVAGKKISYQHVCETLMGESEAKYCWQSVLELMKSIGSVNELVSGWYQDGVLPLLLPTMLTRS